MACLGIDFRIKRTGFVVVAFARSQSPLSGAADKMTPGTEQFVSSACRWQCSKMKLLQSQVLNLLFPLLSLFFIPWERFNTLILNLHLIWGFLKLSKNREQMKEEWLWHDGYKEAPFYCTTSRDRRIIKTLGWNKHHLSHLSAVAPKAWWHKYSYIRLIADKGFQYPIPKMQVRSSGKKLRYKPRTVSMPRTSWL